MGNIYTVGPNEAMVVSGGCCGTSSKKFIIGNWAWAWSFVTDVQKISLEVMTMTPKCEQVETMEGVALTVTGVAQCKVMTESELLITACEQFMGKTQREISEIILHTLEGHLRAILGTLTVESIYQDRELFAQLVREVASPDVGRMGIEILSFTIKDIHDQVDYLSSLGRTQTAVVKRDAAIGVAEAERDAGIQEAECEKTRMDAKYLADTHIADSAREYKMKKAEYDKEVNARKAEAELSYELQAARERQLIKKEEVEITVVERRKQIDVEGMEVDRKEKELMATEKIPAEAEAYKVEMLAEGKKTQIVLAARADADKVKALGGAEGYSISATGKAEAERMRMRAAAYKQYGDAAKLSLILEALPKIAAEVAAPLAKTDEIVLLGNDRTTGELSSLIGQLPPAVQALTGMDLTKVIGKAVGASV